MQKRNDKCVIFGFDNTITSLNSHYFFNDKIYFDQYMKPFSELPEINKDQIPLIYKSIKYLINNVNSQGLSSLPRIKLEKKLGEIIAKDGSLPFDRTQVYELIDFLFGGKSRIEELKKLFQLINQSEYTLTIIGKGNLKEIIYLLKMTDLFKYFNFILAINDDGQYISKLSPHFQSITSTFNKSDFINTLISLNYSDILYIDEDQSQFNRFAEINKSRVNTCYVLSEKDINKCYCLSGPLLIFVGSLVKDGFGLQTQDIKLINILLDMHLYKYLCGLIPQIRMFKPSDKKAHRDPIESRRLTVLSGPSTFCYYPNIYGKRILLLGETHSISNICSTGYGYEVHDWITDLALSAPQCVDFLLEIGYNIEQKGGNNLNQYSHPIIALRDKFFDCLKSKENCLPNIRYHYVDARFLLSAGLIYPYSLIGARLDAVLNYANYLPPLSIDDAHKIFLYFLDFDHSTSDQAKTFHKFMDRTFINQSLHYNSDKMILYIRQFNSMINKQLSKSLPYFKRELFIKSLISVYTDMIRQASWKQIYGILLALPMDVYLLSRLFIKFDPAKMERGPVGCRTPEFGQMKNVIIYGGQAHIDIYRLFIFKYFSELPTIYLFSADNQCLTLPTVFDFFEERTSDYVPLGPSSSSIQMEDAIRNL